MSDRFYYFCNCDDKKAILKQKVFYYIIICGMHTILSLSCDIVSLLDRLFELVTPMKAIFSA